ncbi:MAG: PRC-barrel domain-containing protein [Candidatus Njordarchaeia archaeon]|nr:hypothetical protein [Candidatus Korarchaeota archaeon]
MKKADINEIDIVLFEPIIPGTLIGKEVIDNNARRLGIVKGIRLKYPPLKLFLVVRGKDSEENIPFDSIDKIGTIIKLKTSITKDEIAIHEVLMILENIRKEISSLFKLSGL